MANNNECIVRVPPGRRFADDVVSPYSTTEAACLLKGKQILGDTTGGTVTKEVEVKGDPTYRCGQLVEIRDSTNGTRSTGQVTNVKFSKKGGLNPESTTTVRIRTRDNDWNIV